MTTGTRKRTGFHALYFGEVRGEKNKDDPINYDQVDYRPELALGRWPIQTAEQLRNVVAKTLAFEKRLTTGSKEPPRVALLSVGGWVDSRGAMDRIASSMPTTWRIEKRYDSPRGEPTEIRPPTEKEVLELLNVASISCYTPDTGRTPVGSGAFSWSV